MATSTAVNTALLDGNLAAQEPRIWALVPAAGVGSRMASADLPKQFLKLGAQSILERSVRALWADERIAGVTVVVSPTDTLSAQVLSELMGSSQTQLAYCGGATRAASVANGLAACLTNGASVDDWVLVHDAARPGLSRQALARLIDRVRERSKQEPLIGGLLALKVVDTVKRAQATKDEVQDTVSRDGLWLAQTPQMFRIGALQQALAQFEQVTDEASAMEAAGYPVLLVEGERANFKITLPEDLDWANRLMG